MAKLYFTTHADVVIDPNVPVPDWGLTERGFQRHQIFAQRVQGIGSIWSSDEQKARDGASVVGAQLRIKPQVLHDLHENDRSATGYLEGQAFWDQVDAFFAHPETSIRGWERAVDARSRIVQAVTDIVQKETEFDPTTDVVIVAHGGVGALFRSHILGQPISRDHDQPAGKGGFCMIVDTETGHLVQDWTLIEHI